MSWKMKKSPLIINILAILFTACVFSQTDDKLKATPSKFLPFYDSAAFAPKWLIPNSDEVKSFHKISDFKFMNQEGKSITQEDVKDKIYVASFFFTRCPGICPKMRSQLSKVQDKFRNNEDISIISHSIQPSNDTVEVLKNYAQKHNVISGKWHLVTGAREDIYSIAREDYFANEDLGKFVSNQDFLHTENIVLVDYNRNIRGIYNGLNNVSVNHLLGDIEVLIAEMKSNK